MAKTEYIGLCYMLLRDWHMNGLDLSNVVQIVLACLGIGSNCRRLLLYERLVYNWIQQFHNNEAIGKSMLLMPKSDRKQNKMAFLGLFNFMVSKNIGF